MEWPLFDEKTRQGIVAVIILILMYYYFSSSDTTELFANSDDSLGLASATQDNGTNSTVEDAITAASPCCEDDDECINKKKIAQEGIDNDVIPLKGAVEAAEDDAEGVYGEIDADEGTALWHFSNYRPLTNCKDCKGLALVSLSTDINVPTLRREKKIQEAGEILAVDITDGEGRTDDYEPSTEWIAKKCLEDSDCVGFQLDRTSNTGILLGYGAALDIESEDDRTSENVTTDHYFLHPYRALKYQLSGKHIPDWKGNAPSDFSPHEDYDWKARIRRLSIMQPSYKEFDKHDEDKVLESIPWQHTPWAQTDVEAYGTDADVTKADSELISRRESKIRNKERAQATEAIRFAREAIARLDLNPPTTAKNNAWTAWDIANRAEGANKKVYDDLHSTEGSKKTTMNTWLGYYNTSSTDKTNAWNSYNTAKDTEADYKLKEEGHRALKNAAASSKSYWLHDRRHNSVTICNEKITHWKGVKESYKLTRDGANQRYNDAKDQFQPMSDDKKSGHSGQWKNSKSGAKSFCETNKRDVLYPEITRDERNDALKCREFEYRITNQGKEKWKYGVFKNEYKLLKSKTKTDRATLREYGWKGTKGGDCNFKSVKDKKLTTGGKVQSNWSQCGDCKESNGCHSGTYGTNWGKLSYADDQVKAWEKLLGDANKQVSKYEAERKKQEGKEKDDREDKEKWAGIKNTRYGTYTTAVSTHTHNHSWYSHYYWVYHNAVTAKGTALNLWNNSKTVTITKWGEYEAKKDVYDDMVAEIARLNEVIKENQSFLDTSPEVVIAADTPPTIDAEYQQEAKSEMECGRGGYARKHLDAKKLAIERCNTINGDSLAQLGMACIVQKDTKKEAFTQDRSSKEAFAADSDARNNLTKAREYAEQLNGKTWGQQDWWVNFKKAFEKGEGYWIKHTVPGLGVIITAKWGVAGEIARDHGKKNKPNAMELIDWWADLKKWIWNGKKYVKKDGKKWRSYKACPKILADVGEGEETIEDIEKKINLISGFSCVRGSYRPNQTEGKLSAKEACEDHNNPLGLTELLDYECSANDGTMESKNNGNKRFKGCVTEKVE